MARELPDCINLGVGEPDFCVSQSALEFGWQAAEKGETHYTPTNGIPELRAALAEKAHNDYGLDYDPNCEVLVTCGASEAISLSFLGLVNPGDGVIIPNPGFVGYEPGVVLAGGCTVDLPLSEEREFGATAADVTSPGVAKSRVMLLNFPNNPTGAVLSHDDAASLARVALERDMIVISDEVYEKIVYDEVKHCCMATFQGMRERTLVINSFSKTYAMTGLRVGFVYGPRELIAPLWLVHQYTVTCVDSIAQYVALAALKGSQEIVKDMVREFDRRRHLVHKRLNEMEGFSCLLPKGAFYVFPNIKAFGMSSEAFTEFLLKEARVMTMPGSAYGWRGEGYIRISYASSYERLEEALDRMEKAVRKLWRISSKSLS